MASAIRQLSDLETLEVSLVTKGANKKRFAVVKAEWTAAYVNDLPDSAFLYVEPGGEQEGGKTVPRSLRHFPVRGQDGELDAAHVRNAIARIPQSDAPNKNELQEKARRLLAELQDDGAVTKSEESNMDPVIEAVLKAEIDGEEQVDALLKREGYGAKGAQAFKALFKIARGFADELPKSVLKQLAEATGAELGEPKAPPKDVLAKLDPETKAQVDALFKASAEKDAQLQAIQKQLATEREERRAKEFVAKAAEYKALPGVKTEELGAVLKAVTDAAPDHVAKLEALLKAAAEAIATGEVLKTAGRPSAGFTGNAWAQIQALAKELIQKSDKPLTEAEAVAFVTTQTEAGRKAYEQYNAEKQTGR